MPEDRALALRASLRRSHNWLQLARFATVGAGGYAVNLAVFGTLVRLDAVDYRLAATIAFLAAVANNFLWNRVWTFAAREGHAGFQAARFLCVSVAAFSVNLALLALLVGSFGLPKVDAQALAIAAATPLSFLGNKLWTFQAR